MAQCGLAARAMSNKGACLVVPPLFEQIRGQIKLSRGKMSKDDHWVNNSVVSRIARGPGFESRSGHDFFFPYDVWH